MEGYITLAADAEATSEVVDRKSRFIGQLVHIGSEEDAAAFHARVRARHYDARHNVPAWVLADGRERASDDGEPSRTSGMPVLEVLRGAGLKDVCCVVTRYFGGTLLGSGGLVRAYTAAAQAAVEDARSRGLLVEMTLVTRVRATVPYASYDRVLYFAEGAGAKVEGTDYAEAVTLRLAFHAGEETRFLEQLRELMCGEEVAEVEAPVFDAF